MGYSLEKNISFTNYFCTITFCDFYDKSGTKGNFSQSRNI